VLNGKSKENTMIIQRLHLNVARGFGNFSKVKELCVAEYTRLGVKGRVLAPVAAPFNTIVIEYEWESLSAREQFWAEYEGTEEAKAFFIQFQELIESGGTHEHWAVVATFSEADA
jgi:hypothetical protein